MAEEELLQQILSKLNTLETDITGIKNAMATKEEPEERLTALLDDISQRLETVEILSGQNYVDLIKLRRIK